ACVAILADRFEGNGPTVFAHACKLGLEGIVSKRKDSTYRSGRSPDWLKMKNPACSAVKREAEEDWERWRIQCGLTQNFDIALASVCKLDDLVNDHFISEVGGAVNSRTSGFESYAHETGGHTHATCRDKVLRSAFGGKADLNLACGHIGLCRVGPGNFTPSRSQIRTLHSRVLRLVPSPEGCRPPLDTPALPPLTPLAPGQRREAPPLSPLRHH